MEIKEITNKEIWENFLLQCSEKTFLDSWNWGEFQKKMEEKIWRFGIYENRELIGVALAINIKAKRGTFLFVPHGPNIKYEVKSKNYEVLEILTDKLKEIAKEEKASFIRIAPIWEKSEENIKIFKRFSFREAPIHIHPELTWELDIDFSEEELLMGMRKTTRYLIKQAEKNPEIEIIKSADLEKFSSLLNKTAQRHHFIPFSSDYLKNQLSCFSPDNEIVIFLGKYKGEIISSAIMIYWQKIGFYHHGASLPQNNKIPVSYLLQWEAIKEAKNRGCRKYNFWGIAPCLPTGRQKHPWAGLTLFKMGFGGYRKEYLKTQDLPLSRKYYLTYFFEKARKIKRGL
jgi:lipid II:glycine glycyltransferase (peptidoglycan interpeptide bridge formation enzyme)